MHQKQTNLWWGPPKNFSDRVHERKISWLELFYDLVYVAAIAQLTHHLAAHPSWSAAGHSFLLFSLVFWSWVNGSQYYDLHGNDSIRTRLLTFWQMLAVAAVAITLPDVFEGHHQSFVIAFAVIQGLITYLWWSVGLYDPSHRVFNKFYTLNYIIAFILLIISLFTSYQTANILWLLVLVLNLTPPLTGAATFTSELKKRGQIFTASAALVERFGLFTIIVLAESILGTVTGIAEVKDKDATTWLAFILAILIAFLLWCLYFDMTSEQETKKGYGYMQWFIFLHFPLLGLLGVIGAGIKFLLTDLNSEPSLMIKWMFCISISVILLTITAIARIMEEDEEDRAYIRPVSKVLWITGILMLLIPLITNHAHTVLFLSVISLALFIPVFIGMRSWVLFKFFGKNNSGSADAKARENSYN